jgi:hypothetical protein
MTATSTSQYTLRPTCSFSQSISFATLSNPCIAILPGLLAQPRNSGPGGVVIEALREASRL